MHDDNYNNASSISSTSDTNNASDTSNASNANDTNTASNANNANELKQTVEAVVVEAVEGRDSMSKHTKFWNFIKNDAGERILRLEGPIDSENFWGDAITPKMFREELEADEGDITVWINSPGGSVFAAAEIYTMLCEYSNNKRGRVTVKIDAIAASAASVVAMAGERVLMSPVSMLMIHDVRPDRVLLTARN